MTLLAIVIVFFLIQHWRGARSIQLDGWLFQWNTWFNQRLGGKLDSLLCTLLVIGIPSLVAAIFCLVIQHAFFGLPLLLSLVAILLYSLGRGDFNGLVEDYLNRWQAGDFHGAYHVAKQFSHGQILHETDDVASLHKHASQAMLYQGFERWFAVIFWLVLAGPFGALFYRISFLLANQNSLPNEQCQTAICRVIYWLEWLPLRLFGISVAVMGNFGSVMSVWRDTLWHDQVSTEERLMHYGLAALGEDIKLACQDCGGDDKDMAIVQGVGQIEKLRALLNRTVAFSVVIVAVLIVFG